MLEVGPDLQPRMSLWKEALVVHKDNELVSLQSPEGIHKYHLLRFEKGTDTLTFDLHHLCDIRRVPRVAPATCTTTAAAATTTNTTTTTTSMQQEHDDETQQHQRNPSAAK
jgi:hypothetical protein